MAFLRISRYATINRFAQIAADSTTTNILADAFDRKDIRMQEFYNSFMFPNKSKQFTKCRISGPAMVFLADRVNVVGCRFNSVQIVIAKPGPMGGVVIFNDTSFVDCHIFNLTLVMDRPHMIGFLSQSLTGPSYPSWQVDRAVRRLHHLMHGGRVTYRCVRMAAPVMTTNIRRSASALLTAHSCSIRLSADFRRIAALDSRHFSKRIKLNRL
jgi:hypothetical protein